MERIDISRYMDKSNNIKDLFKNWRDKRSN